jgi:hypothetical protein
VLHQIAKKEEWLDYPAVQEYLHQSHKFPKYLSMLFATENTQYETDDGHGC